MIGIEPRGPSQAKPLDQREGGEGLGGDIAIFDSCPNCGIYGFCPCIEVAR